MLSPPAMTLFCSHGQRTGSPFRTTLRPWQLIRWALPKILNVPLQSPHVASSPSMATCLPLSNIVDVTAMTNPPVVVGSPSLTAVRRMVDSLSVKEEKTIADSRHVAYWICTIFSENRYRMMGGESIWRYYAGNGGAAQATTISRWVAHSRCITGGRAGSAGR
ncbi:hypothetical protein EMIT0158MI4_170125 [Burkholderia ambifaria]